MSRPPEFNKATKDTLAKRSGNLCANPDCRRLTSSSNRAPNKATSIGEAAHIFGARATSARYDPGMTAHERALITNAIWLCTTCHKRVDDDEKFYSAEILLRWREIHDAYTIQLMDNLTEKLRWEIGMREADEFQEFGSLVRRILIDRPEFWEGELTRELLDHFLLPLKKRHKEVRDQLFLPDTVVIHAGEETVFFRRKLAESIRIVESFESLYTNHLVQSWGALGESGDPKEILRVCKLIERTARKAVDWEAELEGIFLEDEDYGEMFDSLKGALGRQLEEILKVNQVVAEIVEKVRKLKKDEKLEVDYTIKFDLPENFNENFNEALNQLSRRKGLI